MYSKLFLLVAAVFALVCLSAAGAPESPTMKPTPNKTLLLIGQNEIGAHRDYIKTFKHAPAGGSMYGNVYDFAVGSNMKQYLKFLNTSYPGSYVIYGLDAKGAYLYIKNITSHLDDARTYQTWQDIYEGKLDMNLKRHARDLRQYTALKFLIRVDYEVSLNLHANTEQNAFNEATTDPSHYQRGFCYIVNKFREWGVSAEFVFHPTRGISNTRLYPGAECADWIAVSIFNNDVNIKYKFQGQDIPSGPIDAAPIDSNLNATLNWAKAQGKKLMIAESSPMTPTEEVGEEYIKWLDRWNNVIETFDVQAAAYINVNWDEGWKSVGYGDSRLETSPVATNWWKVNVMSKNSRFLHYDYDLKPLPTPKPSPAPSPAPSQ